MKRKMSAPIDTDFNLKSVVERSRTISRRNSLMTDSQKISDFDENDNIDR